MPLFYSNVIMKILIKNILIIISIILINLAFNATARAGGNCYNINDLQERALCLGKTGEGSCYMVDDPEERAICEGNCYMIDDPDIREICLSSK